MFLEAMLANRMVSSVRAITAPIWDYPVQQLETRELVPPMEQVEAGNSPMPQKVMQTWEVNEFGRRHAKGLRELRSLNPGFEFRLILREERDDIVRGLADKKLLNLYFKSKFVPMQVDIFRYLYIREYGGYYLDISKAWTHPISSLTNSSSEGLVAFERNRAVCLPPPDVFCNLRQPLNLVCMWGFGFVPNHPILSHALDYISENAENFRGFELEQPKNGIVSLTGPVAFTQGVWRYLRESSGATLTQWTNDFEDRSTTLKGAGFRHLQRPSYANERNAPLFD